MIINLAYGKTGLAINLPDDLDLTLVEPHYLPGLPDATTAIRQALQAPIGVQALHRLISPNQRVGIVFSDLTRPTPNQIILPAVLQELNHVPREQILLFNALGTHRPNTPDELISMLGEDIVESYTIIQNNAFDLSTQVSLGISQRGHEIWLNKELMACDVKILTGFIEPHMFAGFSGGGKALMPGMAGLRTVLGNHDAGMIAHPKATWGITRGNPIWEEINEIAQQAGSLFLVNVSLNRDKQITGVFAGEINQAHAAGCAFVKQNTMISLPEPFDIVITTNSGYPLDLNLYQSVKGMSAAAQVVRQGGAILTAAECWDGIPDHGQYRRLLREAENPHQLLERINTPGFLEQDQWQVQIQAQILLKAAVYLYSHHLSDTQIEECLLQPCRSIESTLMGLLNKYGRHARICVLPEGPQTIPYLM